MRTIILGVFAFIMGIIAVGYGEVTTQPAAATEPTSQPSTDPATQAATVPTTEAATAPVASTEPTTKPIAHPSPKPVAKVYVPPVRQPTILPPSISPGVWTVKEGDGRRVEIIAENGNILDTSGSVFGKFERRPDGLYAVGKSGWVERWGIYNNRYVIVERWNVGGNVPARDPDIIGSASKPK